MNTFFLKSTRRLSGLVFMVMVLLGCQKNDDTVATPPAVIDRIIEDTQFSLLQAAIAYAEVNDALKGANLTLFAPNDAAFQAYGLGSPAAITALPKEQVRALLMYHVLYGGVAASAIPSGQNPVATASKGIAFLNKSSDGKIFINNAQVIQADIAVANGYIHSIDRVLTPTSGNLLTTIQSNPNLSFLAAAVQRIGASNPALLTTLNNQSSTTLATVFAPTNAAFQAAGFNDLAAINAANVQTLTNTLLYHVVSGVVFSNQLQTGTVTTLLNGNRATVTSTANQLTIKGNKNATAAVIKPADISATNGVVHIIDQVLQP